MKVFISKPALLLFYRISNFEPDNKFYVSAGTERIDFNMLNSTRTLKNNFLNDLKPAIKKSHDDTIFTKLPNIFKRWISTKAHHT
jgi:hypothetical protein